MTSLDEGIMYRPMDAALPVEEKTATDPAAKVRARNVSVFYGDKQALHDVS